MADPLDRARAALTGVALGDAMGMPSQTLSRGEIRVAYGRITDFTAPMPGHPVSHGLIAGQVTDDTEQTLLLARHLIARAGRDGFEDAAWAATLLGWEVDVKARGLRDLLGPSSKAALEALSAGAPVTPDRPQRHDEWCGDADRACRDRHAARPDADRGCGRSRGARHPRHARGDRRRVPPWPWW